MKIQPYKKGVLMVDDSRIILGSGRMNVVNFSLP